MNKNQNLYLICIFLCLLFTNKTFAQQNIKLSDKDSISYNKAKVLFTKRDYPKAEEILLILKKNQQKRQYTI